MKLRLEQKKRNYERGRKHVRGKRRRWTEDETEFIARKRELGDRAIALILGRSVEAIQVKRARLRK